MRSDLLKLLGVGLVLFFAGLLLKSVGVAENAAKADDTAHITFVTSDDLSLHVWKSEATSVAETPGHKSGLALLLPMMAHTHDSYDSFRARLNELDYTTLAFDLRGHGLSIHVGNDTVLYGNMAPDDFARLPDDVTEFLLDFQKTYPDQYDYTDVIIIGASIGANTASLLLDRDWVHRAVLLSPGRDYRGLKPETIMAADNQAMDKPVYIAASIDDTYSAESSQWLFDHYAGPKVLKKYPGQAHGTDILDTVEDADTELISWLRPKK